MADKKTPPFVKVLYEKNDFTSFLEVLEKKTGLQREYLVAGFATIILLTLLFGYGTQFVTTVVGLAYPSYETIRLAKSRSDAQAIQWSIYWVVFGFFSLLECCVDTIIKFFPFYYVTKVLMLAWCMAPIEANGCNILYKNVFSKLMGKKD